MNIDNWLFDELSAIDWSGQGTPWHAGASYNIHVVLCQYVGACEGKFYFQGKLSIPPEHQLVCCIAAKGEDHVCIRATTQEVCQLVRWSISQTALHVDDCLTITDVILKDAVYVGQIMVGTDVSHQMTSLANEHACICFRVEHDTSQLIPCFPHDSQGEWALAELFAGGFGGWKQANMVIGTRGSTCTSTHAVEIDPVVASAYIHNFHVQHVFRASDPCMSESSPIGGIDPRADTMFIGDVADTTWMKTLLSRKHIMAAMSSPCPPWTNNSSKDGLEHSDGQLFVQAFLSYRFCRPKCVLAENVATIRTHRHFEFLLKVAGWCGYKMVWETIADLKRVAPVSRKRWLAIFVPTSMDIQQWKSLDFLQLPESSLNQFRVLVDLPEQHERELTLDHELIQLYSNPSFMPKGKFGTAMMNPKKVLESRVKNGSSCLSTIMALYGAQHDLPPHVLSSKGMFTELWAGKFGVRFFSPAETAILHGAIIDFAFPCASRLGHSVVGNCIAVPHAILTMAVARNIMDVDFREDPRETVIAGLLQRLHSGNSVVTIQGDVVSLSRMEALPHEVSMGHDATDEATIDDTEIDLSQTLSFVCSYQVKLILGQEGTHIYSVDPGSTLRELLFNHDLCHLEDTLVLDANGHVFPFDREFQSDMCLRLIWCDSEVLDSARHGGTWQICRQPFCDFQAIASKIEEALTQPIHCLDTMLSTFHAPSLDKHESIVLFVSDPLPIFSRAGFQIRENIPCECFPSELQRVLPTFRVAADHVTVTTNEAMMRNEVVGNYERIMNPLVGILAAIKWEWQENEDNDPVHIGTLKPGVGAAPVLALMNPICRSAVSVALAPSVLAEGLNVAVILDGLMLWQGILHPELTIAQFLGLVKAVILSCGRPLFVSSVAGLRILDDSQATIGSLNTTDDCVTFRLVSQSFGSTLHLWGGGGKVDVWKETKHLLGQELLAHGWSVAGLDAETTHWLRMIGQNKIFGGLPQKGPCGVTWRSGMV
eukprot:Skav219895  [mRNA]  locus=scaffold841:145833:148814:- [translate_table: standard]